MTIKACLWISHNALFWNSQTHWVNDSIKDVDWVISAKASEKLHCGTVVNMPHSYIQTFPMLHWAGWMIWIHIRLQLIETEKITGGSIVLPIRPTHWSLLVLWDQCVGRWLGATTNICKSVSMELGSKALSSSEHWSVTDMKTSHLKTCRHGWQVSLSWVLRLPIK